jgi:hypothetical protein
MADDEKIDYSVGLKVWNNKLGWYTNAANSPIVSLTAKKGDYFLVGSFMLPATYTWNEGSAEYMTRRDTDLAIGWRMNSNVSLLAGQKKLGVNDYYSSSNHYSTLNITYLGANASNSIGEDKFVYGQVLSKISGKNDSNQKVNMTHLEAGFGSMVSKNSQMTLGYRSQKFSNSSSNSSVNLRGYTFGVNHSFN